MPDRRARNLATYIDVKHGFAFEGRYFCAEPSAHVLVTPGNFAIGGGFQEGRAKYYNGPIPEDYILRGGDLVVTMTDLSKAGDTLGYPALIPSQHDRIYLHNQRIGLVSITDRDLLDRDYLYYLLCTDAFRNHILATASGSTVRHTSPSRIREFAVDLPELREQRAAAEVLRTLDDKIEQNRRAGHVLEELARATFKAWFVDFEPVKAKAAGQLAFPGLPSAAFAALPDRLVDSPLGPAPQGWPVGSLVDLCEVLSGGTPKTSVPEYWDGPIGWASAKDVSQCGQLFLLTTERNITDRGMKESATQMIPAFATVIVARGATTGRMTMFAQPLAMNQTCYALVCREHPFFFNFVCASSMTALVQAAHGSVFDTITKSTINNSRIVVPTVEHRTSFEKWVTPLFKKILTGQAESSKLAALRDYLLPRLLSGQVQVKGTQGSGE